MGVVSPCATPAAINCATSPHSTRTVRSPPLSLAALLCDPTHLLHPPPAVDPLVPLTFLSELHDVLDAYIPGPVTQGSLKVRFRPHLSSPPSSLTDLTPRLDPSGQL